MPNLDLYLLKKKQKVFVLTYDAMFPDALDKEEISRVVIAAQLEGTEEAYQTLLRQLDEHVYVISSSYVVTKHIRQDSGTHRRYWKGAQQGVLQALRTYNDLAVPFLYYAVPFVLKQLSMADRLPPAPEDCLPAGTVVSVQPYDKTKSFFERP